MLELQPDAVSTLVPVLYEVEQCDGSTPLTSLQIDNGDAGTHVIGGQFRGPLVEASIAMSPGVYTLNVCLANEGGEEEVLASVHAEVLLPELARQIQYLPALDTLYAVLDAMAGSDSGAHLRFGDGDVGLILGSTDQMQVAAEGLASELQAALSWQGKAVLKTLPLNSDLFGALEPGMCAGNHLRPDELALGMVNIAAKYWQPQPIVEVYSSAALVYVASHFPQDAIAFLAALRRLRPVAFVGNKHVSDDMIASLFGPQCQRVTVDAHNAYAKLNETHTELLHILRHTDADGDANIDTDSDRDRDTDTDTDADSDTAAITGREAQTQAEADSGGNRVVVLMMGPAAIALQYRLRHVHRLFTFDFSSLLDALSNWHFRGGAGAEGAEVQEAVDGARGLVAASDANGDCLVSRLEFESWGEAGGGEAWGVGRGGKAVVQMLMVRLGQVFVHDEDGLLSLHDVFCLVFFYAVADEDFSGDLSCSEYLRTLGGGGDGVVGRGEEMDVCGTDTETGARFAKADSDGNGRVGYHEWYAQVAPPAWIIISGFNYAKRRDFMLRFCREIAGDRGGCQPETMERLRVQSVDEGCSLA